MKRLHKNLTFIIVLVLVVIICTLLGCGQIRSGFVVKKYIIPAYTDIEMMDVGNGISIPVDVDYPTTWYVVVRQTGEDDVVRESSIKVTEQQYDSLKENDWFEAN